MNKRRLLKLAGLLEADAKNKKGIRFDLGTWGRVNQVDDDPASCGTTACACGLAAVSGAFKRQGLGYRLKKRALDDRFDILITLDGKCRDRNDMPGSFRNVKKFFDLTQKEGEFLFIPDAYSLLPKTEAAGERIVAKRIRDFVAGKAHP